jgi:hypothetical protein
MVVQDLDGDGGRATRAGRQASEEVGDQAETGGPTLGGTHLAHAPVGRLYDQTSQCPCFLGSTPTCGP